MGLPIALTPGTIVGGHYIIGNLINSGGFGAVYRGIDTSEGNRPCAIKETYDVTPAARRQALMEAGVLFTVRSPHLPEVYDALEANGRFYLVMQLIEGQNLLQLLHAREPGGPIGEQEPFQRANGPCSEQEVLAWLVPIMEVLQELHSRNPPIMHRDIKPGNIILTPQQTTVLVDFGLTKLYDPMRGSQTLIKAVSEGFSPLEQYLGKTSPQSDIYSVAATMYLLLTNRLPPAAVSRGMQDRLLAPRQLNPALSLHVERVLLKALAVQADQRYQSMREFMQALQPASLDPYADRTIVAAPMVSAAAPLVLPAPPPQVYQSNPYQVQPYQPSTQQGYSGNAQPIVPYQNQPYAPAKGTSAGTRARRPPGGYGGMAPQTPARPVQSQTSPFSQGCLWGLLQGLLTGVLVFVLKRQEAFYLAIIIGLFFCMIAGSKATRKGGSSARAGWSGYWTAIIGTIVFWLTLVTCITVVFVQNVQEIDAHDPNIDPRSASQLAWSIVKPTLPHFTLLRGQPFLVNVVAAVLSALMIAWILGWIGGLLGRPAPMPKAAQRNAPYP